MPRFNEMEYSPQQTVFTLNAPDDAGGVLVRIYASATAEHPLHTLSLFRTDHERWTSYVSGDMLGRFYTFEVFPKGAEGRGMGECPGTFAKAVGVNGLRAAIIDLKQTCPPGWEQDVRPSVENPCDLVVYELHLRDFSVHPSGHSLHKGKYLALTEPGAIFYLKSLGINAVQLQPVFDFSSIDEAHSEWAQYNWGYDPQNYNVPEGSYSTDACRPEVRIREFKQMVMALHTAGIRVIMDVVYNHCADTEDSNFQRTYPDYYFRKTPGTEQLSNGSGCGNETASERPLMRQYMIESVCYWVKEYHVDGFRFDLMGVHDVETMKAIRKALDGIDPSITMYGEGWSAGDCALDYHLLATKQAVRQMPGISAFGNDMRDAIRGDFSDDRASAWLAGRPGYAETVKFGIVGGISHPQINMSAVNYCQEPWAEQPSQYVSYVSCHDDLCLADRLRISFPNTPAETLVRLDQLAQTPVLLGQGIPFLYAGEEVFRDKKRVRNAYRSPDAVNQINWENLQRYPELFLYYRGLIQLRMEHKAFRMGNADWVRRHLHFISAPANVVAFRLDGEAVGDTWPIIYVILNPNPRARKVTIPSGRYTVVCKNGKVNPCGLSTHRGGTISVGARQAVVFHGGK
jgi:pullulanase